MQVARQTKIENTPGGYRPGGGRCLGWVNRKQLNLAEQNEDGSYTYNQNLVEGAALATLQWFLPANENEAAVMKQQPLLSWVPEENITLTCSDTTKQGLCHYGGHRTVQQDPGVLGP